MLSWKTSLSLAAFERMLLKNLQRYQQKKTVPQLILFKGTNRKLCLLREKHKCVSQGQFWSALHEKKGLRVGGEKKGVGGEYRRLFDCTLFIQQRCKLRKKELRELMTLTHNQNGALSLIFVQRPSLFVYIFKWIWDKARLSLIVTSEADEREKSTSVKQYINICRETERGVIGSF